MTVKDRAPAEVSGPADVQVVNAAVTATDTPLPERIGSYRILDLLGEGGTSRVYLAEQREPVRRRVALKVLHPVFDTQEIRARFDSERQALAVLAHPGIAKFYDGGSTQDGLSWFAMEWVRGEPITAYCDSRRLGVRERLRLFVQLCDAVQHAHQKGLIHRDLKPSNVLVEDTNSSPRCKVIDFGLAKAISGHIIEATLVTRSGQMLGTPHYMSPEQVECNGSDIDTRTDIYSLGVMLYELLAGVRPHELPRDEKALAYVLRTTLPPRMATRLCQISEIAEEIAKARGTSIPALQRALRGDLDSIVLKALEADRNRRFATVSELAQDCRRHLTHQPITARPASLAYVLRCFVARHRLAVGAGGLALLGLVSTMSVVALQAQRISAANEDLQSVIDFQAGMFDGLSAQQMGQSLARDLKAKVEAAAEQAGAGPDALQQTLDAFEDATARVNFTDVALEVIDDNVLSRAAGNLAGQFPYQPLVQARLELTIGTYFAKLQRYDKAEPLLRAALASHERLLGRRHRDTAAAMVQLGWLLNRTHRSAEGQQIIAKALKIQRRNFGDEHVVVAETLAALAEAYGHQGQHEKEEELIVEALDMRRRLLGPEHPRTIAAMYGLAHTTEMQYRPDAAIARFEEVLTLQEKVLGTADRATNLTRWRLADLYLAYAMDAKAVPILVEALEHFREMMGDEHIYTLRVMLDLGWAYGALGQLDDAERLLQRALATLRRVRGDTYFWTLEVIQSLFLTYERNGLPEKARPLIVEYLTAHEPLIENGQLGQRHLAAWFMLTVGLEDLRDVERALQIALDINEASDFQRQRYLETLALAYYENGQTEDAIETIDKVLALPDCRAHCATGLGVWREEFQRALISGQKVAVTRRWWPH